MKKLIGFLVLALMSLPLTAKAEMIEGVEINRSAQGINFTQSIDVSKYETLAVQAVYADGTPAGHTITSGIKESGTITVVSNSSALISTQASVQINVVSTTGALGDAVTLNGIVFTEGQHWSVAASTSLAAVNLKTIIDAHPDFAATSAGSTVTVRYVTVGSSGNGLPATTTDSTNLSLSASTFGSGINRHYVTINGTTLTEGVDFVADSSSRTTAGNLTTAINSSLSATLSASSGTTSSVITLTALEPGILKYYIVSSTSGFLVSNFSPGSASEVTLSNDTFSQVNHGLTTGLSVVFSTVAASTIGGLTNQTTYYAIKLNEDQYKLATTTTTAVAGTAIDLTSVPTTNASFTVTPSSLVVGVASFKWQASNDNSNFADLSVSSVTYSAAGTTLWDMGTFAYKYLRMSFLGPTRGGIAISAKMYGREE